MGKITRKNFKKGFTLVELIFVLAIIGGFLLVATLSSSKLVGNSIIITLKANQKIIIEAITSIIFDDTLPSYSKNTNSNYIRKELEKKLEKTGVKIYNPVNGSSEIISTTQAKSAKNAAVIISQRKVSIKVALSNPEKYLYPLNATENSKEKFNGALIVQICEDGYLIYSYFNKNVHNIETIYFKPSS
ncbi:MAG: type II secretion system protein [Thermosipho sp. (in: Bacteria)]|nr:type II secretion system protein [Thermosipho sp. (in: thermotogales)]